MPYSYPVTLKSMTECEAVADAVYRAALGIDHHDLSLFESAFLGEEAILEVNADKKNIAKGFSGIRAQIFDPVGPLVSTHMISNVRVDLKGADAASLTAFCSAQHCPRGKGKNPVGRKFMTGSEYQLDLVKDTRDGLWKIKKWILNVIWIQGDPSVMSRPGSKL